MQKKEKKKKCYNVPNFTDFSVTDFTSKVSKTDFKENCAVYVDIWKRFTIKCNIIYQKFHEMDYVTVN